MNYGTMSDFEINKAVAETLGFKLSDGQHYKPSVGYFRKTTEGSAFTTFNPCNNPADAWPIILENKISIEADSKVIGEWSALGGNFNGLKYDVESSHENPLRAAMIVFLKIKGSGQ